MLKYGDPPMAPAKDGRMVSALFPAHAPPSGNDVEIDPLMKSHTCT
jgi:hypothetical protein